MPILSLLTPLTLDERTGRGENRQNARFCDGCRAVAVAPSPSDTNVTQANLGVRGDALKRLDERAVDVPRDVDGVRDRVQDLSR